MGTAGWVLRGVVVGAALILGSGSPVRGAETNEYDRGLIEALRGSSPDAAVLFEEANAAREGGEWARAEGLYGEVRRLAPEFYHATRRQCGVVAAQGRRAEAVELCREALAAADDGVNLAALARVLLEGGEGIQPSQEEREEALALARRAFEAEPGEPAVLFSVGLSALGGGDQQLLGLAAEKLLELEPGEVSTQYLAFHSALMQLRLEEARGALERARELGLDVEGVDVWERELRAARASSAVALEFAGPAGKVVGGLAWYLVFLLSVTFHEAAHAFAAKRGGDPTAYHGGQVSLNPLPHIRREPLGMVVLPAISLVLVGWPFGFASTPYDPLWADRHPRRAAWMALAGPGANLALVLLAAGLIRLGMVFGAFVEPMTLNLTSVTVAPESFRGAAYLLSLVFSLNLILTVLNLIPLPPLDGAGALPLLFRERSSTWFRGLLGHPMVSSLGLLLAWKLFDPVFDRVFVAVVQLLYPGTHYL